MLSTLLDQVKPGFEGSKWGRWVGEKGKKKKESRVSPVSYVGHLIRGVMRVVLQTGLLPEVLCEEILKLCTLNKVPGSIDVNDTRPIGLLNLWRNMLMGNQLNKIMRTLEELKGISDWQAGFRRLRSTDTTLLETRLVAEHCWVYQKSLWVGDDDRRHAFDSPQRDGGVDMALDRMAVPYEFIVLMVESGARSQMRVRTAHGLSEPFCR